MKISGDFMTIKDFLNRLPEDLNSYLENAEYMKYEEGIVAKFSIPKAMPDCVNPIHDYLTFHFFNDGSYVFQPVYAYGDDSDACQSGALGPTLLHTINRLVDCFK